MHRRRRGPFLEAGCEIDSRASVSPVVISPGGPEEDGDEEGFDAEDEDFSEGEEVGKVGLDRDDKLVRKIADPKLPSSEEVDLHYAMGHLPYRSWCPICIKAQGRDDDHPKDEDKERLLPEYSWD